MFLTSPGVIRLVQREIAYLGANGTPPRSPIELDLLGNLAMSTRDLFALLSWRSPSTHPQLRERDGYDITDDFLSAKI